MVESVFEKGKVFPIKLYQSQIKPFEGDISTIDKKYHQIIGQREWWHNGQFQVQIRLKSGHEEWVSRFVSMKPLNPQS